MLTATHVVEIRQDAQGHSFGSVLVLSSHSRVNAIRI